MIRDKAGLGVTRQDETGRDGTSFDELGRGGIRRDDVGRGEMRGDKAGQDMNIRKRSVMKPYSSQTTRVLNIFPE